MSPKRKIPSRKFAQQSGLKRKIANRPSAGKRQQPAKLATKTSRPVLQPSQAVPQCLWDMGFETLPTMDELRQRYKELSLVLHPDARGSKDAFVKLRENYEMALSMLASNAE